LLKAFSTSIRKIMWLLSFILFMYYIMFIDLCMFNHPCIPEMKPTWLWHMIFLMCCWIRPASIFMDKSYIYAHKDIGL
jgi:hypothetical protein